MKKWRVVLDAVKAPTCGDWVAVSGLCPGEEETARFLFLDGTEADGFTFLDAPQEQVGNAPSGEQVPWLHFPDCMEIVGWGALSPDIRRLHLRSINVAPHPCRPARIHVAPLGTSLRPLNLAHNPLLDP